MSNSTVVMSNSNNATEPPLQYNMMSREEFTRRWERSVPQDWFRVVFFTLLFVALVGNGYELATILRKPKLRKARIFRIVFLVSSADFTFSFFAFIYFTMRLVLGTDLDGEYGVDFHWKQCLIFAPPCLMCLGFTVVTFAVASFSLVFCVHHNISFARFVDDQSRYRAICGFEFKKNNWKLTDNEIVRIVCFGFFFTILFSLLPFAGIGMPDFFDLPMFFMAFAVLAPSMLSVIYFYAQVFKVIAKAAKLKQSMNASSGARKKDISSEIQAARKLLALVIFFLVCWSPAFLIFLLQVVGVKYFRTVGWPDMLLGVSATLNSSLGPFVDAYIFEALGKELFPWKNRKKRTSKRHKSVAPATEVGSAVESTVSGEGTNSILSGGGTNSILSSNETSMAQSSMPSASEDVHSSTADSMSNLSTEPSSAADTCTSSVTHT